MIEFTDVVKSYSEGNVALNGVTMQIEDGEFCFLEGPSGSGKSTIIADEPTGNLDPAKSLEIMSLLMEINTLGTTMLVVTHAQNLVEHFGMRVIAIDEGKVVCDGSEGEFDHEAQ